MSINIDLGTMDIVVQGTSSVDIAVSNEAWQLINTTEDSPMVDDEDIVWTRPVVARVTAIVILMILTLLGNTTLLLLILCNRRLRRRRVNVFLLNLAVGDILVCLVTMSTEIVFVAFGEWVLGALACKLTVYGQIVTLASTTFLLTAMSIDRYQVIVRPLQSLRGQPKVWHKVAAAWAMAFVFATPQLFIFVQTEVPGADGSIKYACVSQGYTQPWQRKAYFSFLATYILVIPTIIMSFCYISIIRIVFMRATDTKGKPKLRFTSSRRPSLSAAAPLRRNSSDSQSEFECSRTSSDRRSRRRSTQASSTTRVSIPRKLISSSKRNVVKMTLSVILAFIVCWCPYFVIGLIRIYSNYTISLSDLYSVAEILAMLHSALNPVLYGAFSMRSALNAIRTACINKQQADKIVINISVGSDFDSLVFVTHPELYTKQLSLADSKRGDTSLCSLILQRLCCMFRKRAHETIKYNAVRRRSSGPHQTKTSSVRSQLSQDSNALVSSHAQCTHTSSVGGEPVVMDASPLDTRSNVRRSSMPSERVLQRGLSGPSSPPNNGVSPIYNHPKVIGSSQGQLHFSKVTGLQGQLQYSRVMGNQGQGLIEHYKYTGSRGYITVERSIR